MNECKQDEKKRVSIKQKELNKLCIIYAKLIGKKMGKQILSYLRPPH